MRRSKEELIELRQTLYDIAEQLRPMTIRSLFYRAVSAGAVEKTEREYKRIVRITGQMRKERVMPFDWLVDAGRFARRANCWSHPKNILTATMRQYRRNYWQDQPLQMEIWTEKDAVVGVIESVTNEHQVALYSCRGYPSLSMIHDAVTSWQANKDIIIRYFGDRDPSGADIPRYIQEAIADINDPDYNIGVDFQVAAVSEDQIDEYNLPTRPTKGTDSRSARFDGESVELDAFSPDDLRELVADSIQEHIDYSIWNETSGQEIQDRAILQEACDMVEEKL